MSKLRTKVKISVPIENENGAEITVPLVRNGRHLGNFKTDLEDWLPYIGHNTINKVYNGPIPS